MSTIPDIEKQNFLLRKRNAELSRKVNAMEQEIALLNYENLTLKRRTVF